MVIQTSQFDFLLMLNVPIPIILKSGDIINVKTPSISEYYQGSNYRRIEQLFLTSIMEIQMSPEDFGFTADGYLDLILGSKRVGGSDDLFDFLEKLTGLTITTQDISFNGASLTEEDVLEVRSAYLIAIGRMDIGGNILGVDQDDEMSKKLSEAEKKIKALRGEKAEDSKITYKDMLVLIMHELDRGPDEIRKLNFFGISELFAVASAAAYDKIQKIAAGNGMMGKGKSYQNILSTK